MTQPVWSGDRRSDVSREPARSSGSANLADILERVLDKGIVIAGDIRINLLDIELLTIKIRLIVASVDRAREMGIDWWEHDPSLSSGQRDVLEENRRLRQRIGDLEAARSDTDGRHVLASDTAETAAAATPADTDDLDEPEADREADLDDEPEADPDDEPEDDRDDGQGDNPGDSEPRPTAHKRARRRGGDEP